MNAPRKEEEFTLCVIAGTDSIFHIISDEEPDIWSGIIGLKFILFFYILYMLHIFYNMRLYYKIIIGSK